MSFEKKEYDLSILIPARNEQFLARTVQDILDHKEGKTEIIIGLDGQWSAPGIEDHPDVTIVYYPESIGQRKMTNQLCRMSKAKYIIKVDAHCAFDQGFDRKLMEDMQDNWTMTMTMRNLHAFNWICSKCGHSRYQGPTPSKCFNCTNTTDFKKDVVWNPKPSPQSNAFTFDSTMHFQYFKEYEKRPEGQQPLIETMSLQGSFFMITREKYWELNICDEAHGSWGQQGVEVALKTWLSGGKVMCTRKTWYAHMFRTQGGDFSFPYPMGGREIDKARKYSRNMWLNNMFEKQIYPLSWLLERFKPLKVQYGDRKESLTYGWHHPNSSAMLDQVNRAGTDFYQGRKQTKSIIYFTDNRLNMKIARAVRRQIEKANLPIFSASLKPMDFGNNTYLPLKRGYLTMFKQILAALKASNTDIVFFCEHDVLYPKEHFDFIPARQDTFYYDVNVWKLRMPDGMALWVDNCRQVSGIAVYRETAIKHYEERVAYVEKEGYNRNMGFEPGTHKRIEWGTQFHSESWMAEKPMIDIRHQQNLTPNRWSPELFRDKRNAQGWQESYIVPGWGDTKKLAESLI